MGVCREIGKEWTWGIGGGRGRGRGVLIDYRRKWEGLRFIFFVGLTWLLARYSLVRSEGQRELLSLCL